MSSVARFYLTGWEGKHQVSAVTLVSAVRLGRLCVCVCVCEWLLTCSPCNIGLLFPLSTFFFLQQTVGNVCEWSAAGLYQVCWSDWILRRRPETRNIWNSCPFNRGVSQMARLTETRWRYKVAFYKGVSWYVSLYHLLHIPWFAGSGDRTSLVTSSGFDGIHPIVFTRPYHYTLLRLTQYLLCIYLKATCFDGCRSSGILCKSSKIR